jgi:nicotinate phosphoribosyltransferase
MAAAYYYSNYQTTYDINKIKGIFEMFVRKLPRNRSYLVAAGLEDVLYFLVNVNFNEGQSSYLKSLKIFEDMGEDFFEYLSSNLQLMFGQSLRVLFCFLTNQS